MNTLVIYHKNCNDGFGAAYLTSCWLQNQNLGVDLQPATYGDTPPDVTGRHVEIVDFSYPRDVLLDMDDKALSLRVIDHHKTAEDNCRGLDFCKFDMSRCATMIVWDEICGGEPPEWVKFVQDRDLWTKELPNTDEVAAYLRTVPHDLKEWGYRVSNKSISEIINAGLSIREYQKMLLKDAIDKQGTTSLRIGGHQVPGVNYTAEYSEIAGDLAVGHPFAAVYFIVGLRVVFSLRSHEGGLDVSDIAKQYGGGGHKHAAGFSVTLSDLPKMVTV